MRGRNTIIHLCSFSAGCFRITSKSGKQVIFFEDSDRFGPERVDMRTGDLSPLPEKSWFWDFYDDWRTAGRPTSGAPLSTPHGALERAVWATSDQPGDGHG